jgi:hypothetical protein
VPPLVDGAVVVGALVVVVAFVVGVVAAVEVVVLRWAVVEGEEGAVVGVVVAVIGGMSAGVGVVDVSGSQAASSGMSSMPSSGRRYLRERVMFRATARSPWACRPMSVNHPNG